MTFPYKLGALPAQRPVGLGLLTDYVAGSLPKPPPSVKVPAFTWGMLGNDEYGDCGVAGLEHGFEADALAAHEHETWPDDQAATEYYLDYTGGEDTGVVLTQYLAYVRQHGYYGHTLRAFAPVAVHDVPTLQTAIFVYGFAYTGIAVTAGMQQAFEDSKPWTSAACSGPVIGGHCVPLVGYDDSFLYAVTWGGIAPITYPAWHSISSEAHACITGEFVARGGDGRGVNLSALEADLDKLAA